jgi:hypothetical protein
MSVFIYLFRAFTLLSCAFSGKHRAETRARWKKTPTHLVIYEVGGGIMGLIILGALIFLIVVHLT